MARLTGPPDRILELRPLSYEFAEADNESDANWLVVQIAVADGPRRWSATEPAFRTWELVDLICWLRNVVDGAPRKLDKWGGREPQLELEVEGSGESVRIRALFSHEFHPQFRSWRDRDADVVCLDDPVSVEFTPGMEALHQFADELERELARFPERSPGN